MMKQLISVLIAYLFSSIAMAQAPEMADTMRANGKIYVVVGVIALIFATLLAYLIYIDMKLRKVENQKGVK